MYWSANNYWLTCIALQKTDDCSHRNCLVVQLDCLNQGRFHLIYTPPCWWRTLKFPNPQKSALFSPKSSENLPKCQKKNFCFFATSLQKIWSSVLQLLEIPFNIFCLPLQKISSMAGGGGGGRMAPRVPTPPDFVAIGDKCHWMLTLWIIRKWTPREDQTLARANSFYPPPSGSM